jgi:hypothetical protein
MEYLASPHKTAKYVTPLDTFVDFQNRRAVVVEGHEDAILTLTAAHDIAGVVAAAVDLETEWPEVGGIRGNRVTVSQIIRLGEKIRGESQPTCNQGLNTHQHFQVDLSLLTKSSSKISKQGF